MWMRPPVAGSGVGGGGTRMGSGLGETTSRIRLSVCSLSCSSSTAHQTHAHPSSRPSPLVRHPNFYANSNCKAASLQMRFSQLHKLMRVEQNG